MLITEFVLHGVVIARIFFQLSRSLNKLLYQLTSSNIDCFMGKLDGKKRLQSLKWSEANGLNNEEGWAGGITSELQHNLGTRSSKSSQQKD